MRKLSIILLFILIMIIGVFNFTSEAGYNIVYDGKTHTYNEKPVSIDINGERLNPPVPPLILNDRTVVPVRAVFEKMGASVEWDAKTQQVSVKSPATSILLKIDSTIVNVNGSEEQTDMPAKIVNDSTMIPLRFVSEKLGLNVVWDANTRIITITTPVVHDGTTQIKDVVVSSESGKTLVKVEATGAIDNYSKIDLDSPDRLVIDIPDSIIDVGKCNLTVGNSYIDQIRAAQHDSPMKSRIVLDLVKKTGYDIKMSSDKKTLIVEMQGDTADSTEPEYEMGKEENIEELNTRVGSNTVSMSKESDKTVVNIRLGDSQVYTVSRLTDFDGIAVDITNAEFSQTGLEIPINDPIVKFLRNKKITDNMGRIIIGVEGQPQYQVVQQPGEISVYVFKSTYKNIRYTNSGDTVSITLDKADIKNQITVKENPESKKITFSIPKSVIDLGLGSMHINDSLVSSLDIVDNSSKGSDIVVNYIAGSAIFYNIRNDSGKTVIDLSTKKLGGLGDSKYLVVIDAGHGGYDPGAKYKEQLKEKDLNLDIAKRLNTLLKNAGVETVMTRDSDVFVELHERANIANELKADLFVSIHNNWIDSPSYGGTMTLYYPDDDNGNPDATRKEYAQIVQNELLKSLGTTDRKIIPRPNLVVLNSTEMPAVLAEIAFLSNSSDRQKLLTDSFKQSAAQGLFNGVEKVLGKIKK